MCESVRGMCVRVWICKFATLLTAIHASFALSLLKTNLLVALLFLRHPLTSLSSFSIHCAGQLIWQRLLLLLLLYLSLSLPSLYLPPPAILVATLMCCLSNQRVTDADAVPVFPKKIDYPPPPSVPCCRLLAVTRLTKLRSSARDSGRGRGREGEGRWLSGVMLYGMFDQSFWYSGIFCSISIWHLIRAQTICTTMELPCTEMKNNLRTLSLERRGDGVLKQ